MSLEGIKFRDSFGCDVSQRVRWENGSGSIGDSREALLKDVMENINGGANFVSNCRGSDIV